MHAGLVRGKRHNGQSALRGGSDKGRVMPSPTGADEDEEAEDEEEGVEKVALDVFGGGGGTGSCLLLCWSSLAGEYHHSKNLKRKKPPTSTHCVEAAISPPSREPNQRSHPIKPARTPCIAS